MATYKQHIYYEKLPDHTYPIPEEGFKIEYRGFEITKDFEFHLYYIVPREAAFLPNMIDGRYTKLDALKYQIDTYFREHPEQNAETAYTKRSETPKRGRKPYRNKSIAEEVSEERFLEELIEHE